MSCTSRFGFVSIARGLLKGCHGFTHDGLVMAVAGDMTGGVISYKYDS